MTKVSITSARESNERRKLLTPEELAECLGISKYCVCTRSSRGERLKVVHVGARLRYRRDDIEEWLDRVTDDRKEGWGMPRAPLEPGRWGRINRTQVGASKWLARVQYRTVSGVMRTVEAPAPTAAAAQRALECQLDQLRTDESLTGLGAITPSTLWTSSSTSGSKRSGPAASSSTGRSRSTSRRSTGTCVPHTMRSGFGRLHGLR